MRPARRKRSATSQQLASPTAAVRDQLCWARIPPHENTEISISVRPKRR
jgi:hypothetical protein